MEYVGRFAPSPTGPMHFGTLIAAVASYLQARTNDGKWLLRIEDIDELRCVDGADKSIIASLEKFGFRWDGDIVYQSDRKQAYQQALQTLKQRDLVFPCTCSRKQLAAETGEWSPVYPGNCRDSRDWQQHEYAVRCRVDDAHIDFVDSIYGEHSEQLADSVGDFVIKRRDGLFAYQLAVVVDDHLQGVTEIVRGTDLIDSTCRQIYLQHCLGYKTPAYFHFPIAVDHRGDKLSKSTLSTAIDDDDAVASLNRALVFLGQRSIETTDLDEYWDQAIASWDPMCIPRSQTVTVD